MDQPLTKHSFRQLYCESPRAFILSVAALVFSLGLTVGLLVDMYNNSPTAHAAETQEARTTP